MTAVLGVAVGLALVFSAFSMACSAVAEVIATACAMRGRTLWKGIDRMVGEELGEKLREHHLVNGMAPVTWWTRLLKALGLREAPVSYLPSNDFVRSLLDVLGSAGGDLGATAPGPTSADELRGVVAKVPDDKVKRALVSLVDDAGGDLERAKTNIAAWFDAGMERVSGWYKRRLQLVLAVVGLFLAGLLGVDALEIGSELWRDPVLREAMTKTTERFVADHKDGAPEKDLGAAVAAAASRIRNVESLGFPMSSLAKFKAKSNDDRPAFWVWLGEHWIGFLLTAFAASMGAPFWFDLLGKFVNLRSSGTKPPPASQTTGPARLAKSPD